MSGPVSIPPPRRAGPTLQVVTDLFRHASTTRRWLTLVVVVVALVAAGLLVAGQTVLPWTIYPAL